jgi:type II secretory pathway pseudopilin PulG
MPTTPLTATVPPARPGSRRRFAGSETGFTLIEVLVSALLVILIASAAATALIATGQFSGDQRTHSQADALASQDQERLRGLSDDQLGGLNQTRQVLLNGITFSVQSVSTYIDTTGSSSCTSTAAAYYKIASTVTWTDSLSSNPATLTEDSLLTRPVTGDLLTQVTDQTGAPLPGVNVSAAGASPQANTTDSNGCVLFAGLAAGSYTVALTPATGYVDGNGNSAPTGTAAVTTASTAVTSGNPFHFGSAGSIVGTFAANVSPGVTTTGEADGLSWIGSGGYPMTGGFRWTPLVDPPPATGFTTGLLFPFATAPVVGYANNYTVWGGRCKEQAPQGTNPDEFTVNPGSLGQVQNIPEPLLSVASVTFKNGSTNPVKPSDVKLTFNGASGCQDSWYPTLTTATTLPANGWLLNPGQPYAPSGTLTVCADYLLTGSYYNATVTTSNTSFIANNSVPTIPIIKTSSSPGAGRCT